MDFYMDSPGMLVLLIAIGFLFQLLFLLPGKRTAAFVPLILVLVLSLIAGVFLTYHFEDFIDYFTAPSPSSDPTVIDAILGGLMLAAASPLLMFPLYIGGILAFPIYYFIIRPRTQK